MEDNLGSINSAIPDYETHPLSEYNLDDTFWQEIERLIDREIIENQILAADVESLDARHQTAVLMVWRRAPQKDSYGDGIEELRSLVTRDGDGKLLCWVIQGSRSRARG